MELRALRYFLAVADQGSFTRAASVLHVSQPAISLAIAKLEDELDARLFDRGDRQVRATEAGERLIVHARAMLAQAARARADVHGATPARSVVRFGVPILMAATWLPAVIARFLTARPDVQIEIVQAGARVVESRVAEGTLDLGLITEYQPSAQVSAVKLLEAELGVCVAANHRLARLSRMTWSAFLAEPLVLFPRGYYQRELIEAEAARRRVTPLIVAESDSIPIVKAIFATGTACGLLLRTSVARGEALRVVPMEPAAHIRLSACIRKMGQRPAAVEALLQHLIASAAKEAERRA